MNSLETLKRELESVKTTLAEIGSEVSRLREDAEERKHPLELFLWQRGFTVLSHGNRSQLLLPPNVSKANEVIFYEHMRRYSFRLFLRDLVQFPESEDSRVLARYCSLQTVRSYLKFLTGLGVVETIPPYGYRLLLGNITSFGPTLEWYVSRIFEREFFAPALFNVRLRHTEHGGDYDVVTLLSGHLVYAEVKSSPPRGVELPAISAFLDRLRDMRPHRSVFLVDTELRMRDKIVPLFEEAIGRSHAALGPATVARLANEIFHIGHSIYLMNSRKGIYSNLRYCLKDFLHWETHSCLP